MVDVLTRAQRKLNMSNIRGRDTKPEKLIRNGLHRLGFRFRLHHKSLPGRPDLVFPRYNAVIFVHGCFWHGHDCPLFKLPATRRSFWLDKISGNFKRDQRTKRRCRKPDGNAYTGASSSKPSTLMRPGSL